MSPLQDRLTLHATILSILIVAIWVPEILDQLLLRGWLNRFGIRPRTQAGLLGILVAPFLHGTWSHLVANTPPLIVLGWLVMVQDVRDFWIVTGVVVVVSGLGVWLLGASNSIHIGASGVIFGYLGFLLLRSYFDRNAISATISVLVALLYGNLIWGFLPGRRGVSWLGHLFGFLGGVLASRYLPELRQGWEWLGKVLTQA